MDGGRSRHRLALIAALILLVTIGSAAGPATDEFAALRDQVDRLFDQGKFAEATPLAERYAAMVRKKHGEAHSEFPGAIFRLANVYKAQGRYADAEPLYKRALAVWEKALGPEHQLVGAALNNLGDLCSLQGRYVEAEPLFKRALAVLDKALNPEHQEVGTALNNLADLYRTHGRYAETEPLYKHALAVLEKALGPEHQQVGYALNNLAVLYQAQGSVSLEATVSLITQAVGAVSRDKTLGRAEALRRAMLAMIDNGKSHEAHPAYWAPFVVEGEGAAR